MVGRNSRLTLAMAALVVPAKTQAPCAVGPVLWSLGGKANGVSPVLWFSMTAVLRPLSLFLSEALVPDNS